MEKKYNYVRKYFTHNGRRYTVYGKTEKEAVRKMIEKKVKLEKEQPTSGGQTLLRDWYQIAFSAYKPNVSDRYMNQCLIRFKKHVVSEIGSYPLNKITPLMLQGILNNQKGMSRSHITKLHQDILFVFDAARKNHMISINPAADLVRPTGTNHKRRSITEEEREHLLKVIPQDPRFIFFELMLYCGCRPAEAAEVRYDDVVKIDEVPFLHIRGTKTVNSDRYVPIPTELQPKLLSRSKGYCAVTAAGSHHTESSYKRMVHALERALNISMGAKVYRNQLIGPLPLASDFVPYLLRHTYCTDLKKKGVDLRIAKDLMGHADIKTTANIYDHSDGDTLLIAARQMGLCE